MSRSKGKGKGTVPPGPKVTPSRVQGPGSAATRPATPSAATESHTGTGRRRLLHLYEISLLLARFESVERTVPAVLALATAVLHVRIAILVEGLGAAPLTSLWHATSVGPDALGAATKAARASYDYLVGSGPATAAEPGQARELAAMNASEMEGQERRWILPLTVERHAVFGVLYVQCRDALDELDLKFVSAVANQLAVALDRHHVRRREVALRERAETLAVSEQAARAREHEAVEARDAFILVASHELRNPLNTLSLQIAALLRKAANEDVAHRLHAAMRQTERMTRLVGGLLDVSRATAGRLDLELADVDLAALVKDEVDRSMDELRESGCALTLAATRPVLGRWDRLRLEQIVTNLLSNSLKYGRGKPIDVAVELHDQTARLVVRDRGVGVTPGDEARIFERFERSAEHRGTIPGLGLGLWIVRQIVQAMDGTIRVESQPGQGSVFTVDLPVSMPERARPS